jgi:hypothetical protein
MKSTASMIQNAVGVYPKYIRPPYGCHDSNVVHIAHSLGQKVVNWNVGKLIANQIAKIKSRDMVFKLVKIKKI